MMLVERDHELSFLGELFADTLAGRGRAVVVTGPVASGKTELLHTFAEEAVRQGALFLSATASHAERALPLGVLGQLVRGAELTPEHAERVARLLDDGAFSAMINEPESEAAELVPAHILHRLCMALLDLADRQPLVVAVDDVHHTDLPSLECLSYLVRRLRSTRALVLLTEAARPQPAHPLFHAELLRQPHCRRIRLAPLSRHGVELLLGQRLAPDAARRLAPEAHAVSGGNPLLVTELIADHLAGAGSATEPLLVGSGFSQALVSCLYRSEFSMLKLVRGLAVLGGPSSPDLLGELVDLPAKSAVAAMNALTVAGMLAAGWFRHPAARAAVLDGMLPEERAAMHTRAARLLHAQGTAAPTVATHLLAADRVDDPWAVPVLHEAADLALADSDLDLAVSCLRLAQHAAADEAQRAASRVALGEIEWRVNPAVAIRHAAELTAAVRAGQLTGPRALAPVNWLLWFGRVDEALETLEQVDRWPQPADPEAAESRFSTQLWLHMLFPSLRGRAGECQPPADPDRASRTVNPKLQAVLAFRDVLRDGANEATVTVAEQLLHGNQLGARTLGPLGAALAALIYGDQLEMAARWCDPLLREAEARRAPTWQALFATLRAEIAVRQGDLEAGEFQARNALRLLSPRSWGVAIGAPLGTLLQACTGLGDYDEAVSHLRMPLPDILFQTPIGVHYLQARGRYFHATGRYSTALADFQSCGELMARWQLEFPAFAPWWSDAAQSCLRLGRHRQARDLVLEQLKRLGPGHARTRGISLRVLAATSDPKQRPALLREAVEALRGCGDRLELAAAMGDLGHAQQSLGESSQARMMLHRAHHLATQCGAEPLRRRLLPDAADARPTWEARLPAAAEQPTGQLGEEFTEEFAGGQLAEQIPELSEAERRVAVLAVQGHTNRQIADKLYVTVSTVEQHLTRVYRKLRVNRRTDLRLRLDARIADSA
jgi:DNA-binding CsgD family transcriptional regulator